MTTTEVAEFADKAGRILDEPKWRCTECFKLAQAHGSSLCKGPPLVSSLSFYKELFQYNLIQRTIDSQFSFISGSAPLTSYVFFDRHAYVFKDQTNFRRFIGFII